MSLFICNEATPPAPSVTLRELLISRNPVCQLRVSGGLCSIKHQYYGHQFAKFRKSSSYKHQDLGDFYSLLVINSTNNVRTCELEATPCTLAVRSEMCIAVDLLSFTVLKLKRKNKAASVRTIFMLDIQVTSIAARKTLKPTQCIHSKTQKAQLKDEYLQSQLQETKTHMDI